MCACVGSIRQICWNFAPSRLPLKTAQSRHEAESHLRMQGRGCGYTALTPRCWEKQPWLPESVSLCIKWIIKSHVLDNIHKAERLVPKEKLDIYLHMGLGLKIWGSLASAQYILEKLRVEPNFEVCRIQVEFFLQEERMALGDGIVRIKDSKG